MLWQLEAGKGKSTHSPTKCYAERGVEAEEEDNNASERDLQGLTAFALGARESGCQLHKERAYYPAREGAKGFLEVLATNA